MRHIQRWIVCVLALSMVATTMFAAPRTAEAEVANFPDGTEVEITIDTPVDGASPVDGAIDMAGTARVGAGNTPADTALVVAFDLSTSTLRDAGGDCGGDFDSDGVNNTILDCEIASIEALEQSAIALGSVAEMGVVAFERLAGRTDVTPTPEYAWLTTPGADLNNNGQTDISEVVRSTRVSGTTIATAIRRIGKFFSFSVFSADGGTNHAAGFQRACSIFAASSQPERIVVFISDGGANRGNPTSTELPCPQPATVFTVAVGAGQLLCDGDEFGLGSLRESAELTGGTCTEVTSPDQLPDVLGGILAPEIYRLGLSVNGGAEVDISGSASVALPARGPAPISWSTEVEGLSGADNELCVTVYARRGADEFVEAVECVTVGGNQPPVAAAGADQVVSEGALVTVNGTGSVDADGDPLTFAWEVVSQSGQPPLLTSTTEPVASFVGLDDGVYELALTVSDGRESSTDTTLVTVQNAAPVVSALAEPASEGGVALITASLTDPGVLDTHSATVDWGDGTGVVPVNVSAQGNGWASLFATHTYAGPGAYTATITVSDDDGAVATAQSVGVQVGASVAVWSGGSDFGIEWSGSDNIVTGLLHSNDFLKMNGSNSIVGPVEYVTGLDDSGEQPFSSAPQQVSPSPYPVNFTLSDYQPGGRAAVDAGGSYFDMSGECGDKWDAPESLQPGLYYVPCEVVFSDSSSTGEITIVATGPIEVSGSDENFRPFIDGLLFFTTDDTDKAVKIAGSNNLFLGYTFAPFGWIELSGSENTYTCGVLGAEMKVSGSSSTFRASDCVRPERTVAPPTLAPNLDVTVDVAPEVVLPGSPVTTTTTVTNTGSLLLVPGVVGIENLGNSTVTVTDISLGIEYLPTNGGGWTPLTEPITVSSTPNPHPNVAYAATGFAGTVVQPDGLATWGAELQVDLPPATVNFLLDPSQVAAIRNTFNVNVDNPSAPVRSLFRFGNDFAPQLRALSGSVTDVQVFATSPDGATLTLDAAADPRLATLAPGESADVAVTTTVPVPAPRGDGEPSDAYLARLASLNNTGLVGSAFALSTGGVGTVLGAFTFDATNRVLPIVNQELTGTDAVVAGDTANFDLELRNTGAAAALAITTSATGDGTALTINDAPTELDPGVIEPATFAYTVPANEPVGLLPVQATTTWQDTNGNLYGTTQNNATVEIATPPDLSALLADDLLIDADNTGVASAGDTVRYSATVTNRGTTAANGVMFALTPDADSSLVIGSVLTDTGTVLQGNNTDGDDIDDVDVLIDIGAIAPMSSAEISFEVVVNGGGELSVQGLITSTDLPDFTTDDPGFSGSGNPTVTVVLEAESSLTASLTLRLSNDGNGDDLIGPGDVVEYTLRVINAGQVSANAVSIALPVDDDTTLVAGSANAVDGVIVSGNTEGDTEVAVDFVEVPTLNEVVVTFEARINDPLDEGANEISFQAQLSSDEQAGLLSDDPNDPGTADPTAFEITITAGVPTGGDNNDGGNNGGGNNGGGNNGGGGSSGTGDNWGFLGSFDGVTPGENAIVSAPTPVSASITPPDGTTVATWEVSLYPTMGSSSDALPVASGTGTPPAELGTLDPSTLANGAWMLRIEAEDDAGGMGVFETSIIIDGNLKLGRYAVTYQDSNVSVGGIPIQVLRSYDTLERVAADDFGFGWTLDVANFEVAVNRPISDPVWSGGTCGAGLIFAPLCYEADTPRIVSVTWPNGIVDRFQLTPTGSTFITGLAIVEYSALPGTNSKLFPAAGDEDAALNGNGGLSTSLFFPGELYDPTQFIMEAQDGTRYLLDIDDGLIQATDRDGNTVTYSDAGIISSQGPSITFDRDAEGRITSLTEPDGATVSYGYDANGDLISATDQNSNTTTFTYEAGHYLSVIDDPGPGPFRTMTYGVDGRVESITDANGNVTNVSFEPDGRTQVVTSPDGNLTTVTTSDDRGNVVSIDEIYDGASHISTATFNGDDLVTSRTNAVGNTWSASYDGDQNLTQFTDAENNVSVFSYDTFGFPLTITDAEGGVTQFSYDAAGNVSQLVDARGGSQSFTYDSAGNQTGRTDQLGRSWVWAYDGAGRLTSATDPRNNTVGYSYDSKGRVITVTAADSGVTTYGYDPVGNVTSITDPLGRQTTYGYDSRDLLASMTDPAAATTSYAYDDVGRLLSRTDPTARTWSYSYAFDRLVTETAPDSGTIVYGYDGAGRVDTMTDQLGRTTSYGYDGAHRRTTTTRPIDNGGTATTTTGFDGNSQVIAVINAENETTSYVIDGLGRRVEMLDGLNRSTTYGYDEVGNRTSVTNPAGETRSWGFDLANQNITVTDANGDVTTYSYDLAGNMSTVTDPLSRVTSFSYDSVNRRTGTELASGDTASTTYDLAGQVQTSTSAAGYTSSYGYDPRGLIASISDQLNNTTLTGYDAAGRTETVTDARGNATTFGYDSVGRLETETDPLGGTVTFGYDLAGQRTSVSDPNGSLRVFAFDDGGRLTSASDALGRTTSYGYDAVGRQTRMTDPRGITIDRIFDDAGQLFKETSPSEERTFFHDPAGRISQMIDATGTTNYGFDNVGRLTSVASTAGTVSYGYNAAGEQISMTQPEGVVGYGYDVNGNMDLLTDWRTDTLTVNNDADGRMLTATASNGVDTTYGYDGAGRLDSIIHNGLGGLIDSFDYTLDANGNRTAVTTPAGTEQYTIDPLNRLTQASYTDGTSESFGYDPAGYRLSHDRTDGTTVTYSYDAAGQIGSDSDGVNYTYDAAGNLTGTSDGDSYGFDDWGYLTSATAGGVTQTYAYDAAGVRVDVDGNTQLWDRSKGLPTLISTSDGNNYLHAPNGVARAGDTWLHADAIGTIRAITDTSGAVIAQQDFSVFGEPQTATTGDFGFAGEQLDPTGLIHLRARQYYPTTGTFLTVDPIQPGAPSTAGWNLYTYTANNPTTWTDPSGQTAVTETGITNGFSQTMTNIAGGLLLCYYLCSTLVRLIVALWDALKWIGTEVGRNGAIVGGALLHGLGELIGGDDEVDELIASDGANGDQDVGDREDGAETQTQGGDSGDDQNNNGDDGPPDVCITVLYHGSQNFEGDQFDLSTASNNISGSTPESGIYLTDDFNRAATGYGRGGQVARTEVPCEFADAIRQLGGPNADQPEYFVNNQSGVDTLNNAIRVLDTQTAIIEHFGGSF